MSNERGDGPDPTGSDGASPLAIEAGVDDKSTVNEVPTEEATAAAVAAKEMPPRRRQGPARAGLVGLLVVLFSIMLPLTATLTWAHYTVLNSDGFNDTFGPLISNEAVSAAAGSVATEQIFSALNAQNRVAGVLPPNARFLAAPITNGAKGYIQGAVTKVLRSQQFDTVWRHTLRFTHDQITAILERQDTAVTGLDHGYVTLNLVPLVNESLGQLQGFVSGVIGKPITLPTISADEVPAQACGKISAALDRPLPAECGQIPLFPAAKLTQARRAVKAFNKVWVLLIVTPVLAALALVASRRRRRTLLQLSVGGFLGLVVVRRVLIWLEHSLVNSGRPQYEAARQAVTSQVFHVFFEATLWLLVAMIVVLVLALLSGPYPWARASRRFVARIGGEAMNIVEGVVGRARDDATIDWMRSHLDLLRFAGVGVAAILLLWLSVSYAGALTIIGLLIGYEVAVTKITRSVASAKRLDEIGTKPP